MAALLLMFVACRKERIRYEEREFNLSGFDQVYAGEKMNVAIQYGAGFSVKAKGPGADIDKLDLRLVDNNQVLDISYKDGVAPGNVDVVVTMPHLEKTYMNGEVTATIRGFESQVGNVGITMSGKANVTAYDGATIFAVDISGNAVLTLNGHTASLAGEVSGNGIINAYGLTATRVYITTTHNAKVWVRPLNIFFGSASDNSRISYQGDPQDKQLVTYGSGQIVKE